jgi:K+-sensing histidine kinase KdpD
VIEGQVGVTRMTTLSPRSASWQKNVSGIEWLSTSIVHDLRNPLGAIYAAAEMLMEVDDGPTQVKRLATNIFRAAGRMRELLADLNSVARGERPRVEMCDIREVLAAASDAASAITKNHNVQILLEVPEGVELPLIRSRMERVFFNLIANSFEAMPTGGKLNIVCRKANRSVLIEVEDTGPGIPRGIRDRLFEPFVTAGKQDGLGLGLALSRQTLLNHGGDIWTEPATGARFVIRLPLNRARSEEYGPADIGTLAVPFCKKGPLSQAASLGVHYSLSADRSNVQMDTEERLGRNPETEYILPSHLLMNALREEQS